MRHEYAVENRVVEGYLLDDLSPEERDAFEEHYFECTVCAQELIDASRFLEEAKVQLAAAERPSSAQSQRERFAAEPEPEPSRPWFWWLQPRMAAPVMAAMAVALCVQSFYLLSDRGSSSGGLSEPRAVISTVLRPQTRGAVIEAVSTPGQPLLLRFDVRSSSEPRLRYRIESAAGDALLTIDGDAPPLGQPVNLFIPNDELPPGRYTIVVVGLNGSGQEGEQLGTYPFNLNIQ